jgi:hypothetical protein
LSDNFRILVIERTDVIGFTRGILIN